MMQVSLALAWLTSTAFANIKFRFVQPRCDPSNAEWSGCLQGQYCNDNATCHPAVHNGITLAKRALSQNGQCGAEHDGILCDPLSTIYTGTCCSQYGWCGNTPAHCGTGCQSNCNGSDPPEDNRPISTTAAGPDPRSVSSNGAIGEPTIKPAQPSNDAESTGGGVTTDGTCGATNGGTVCGNWPRGGCCSMYGFCGSSPAHCDEGCQSGPCTNAPSQPAPGPRPAPAAPNGGFFEVVGQSGVAAMHAALMDNGRLMFLDKVENYGPLRLPNGRFAYSSEYDPETNTAVPLAYRTNAFCSGGCFLPDGRLINVGGNAPLDFIDPTVGDGFTALRYLSRSATDAGLNGQDWSEPGNKLDSARWYASAQTMPDGTIFVASGSLNGLDPSVAENNNPTYEILSPQGITGGGSIPMNILVHAQPYYMYPFLHVLPQTGDVFVLVSKSAEIFNPSTGATVRTLPNLPGLFRTYPNTGTSVLLPLRSSNKYSPEVLVCGGGAYQDITSPSDPSCGRIAPLAQNPTWEMDSMPQPRVMPDAVPLPDGTILILNGCSRGAQGFGLGAEPTLQALLYNPTARLGDRFRTLASSTIARLYHSVALLNLDGTVTVTGSNPVEQPVQREDVGADDLDFTEYRVETYTPPYLATPGARENRPANVTLSSTRLRADGGEFGIEFVAPVGGEEVRVVLYTGGFVTHSLHMGARVVDLDIVGSGGNARVAVGDNSITVSGPPDNNVAPPGPYVVFVLVDGVPGRGVVVSVVA